jgi:hypothetical protein
LVALKSWSRLAKLLGLGLSNRPRVFGFVLIVNLSANRLEDSVIVRAIYPKFE